MRLQESPALSIVCHGLDRQRSPMLNPHQMRARRNLAVPEIPIQHRRDSSLVLTATSLGLRTRWGQHHFDGFVRLLRRAGMGPEIGFAMVRLGLVGGTVFWMRTWSAEPERKILARDEARLLVHDTALQERGRPGLVVG